MQDWWLGGLDLAPDRKRRAKRERGGLNTTIFTRNGEKKPVRRAGKKRGETHPKLKTGGQEKKGTADPVARGKREKNQASPIKKNRKKKGIPSPYRAESGGRKEGDGFRGRSRDYNISTCPW